MLHEKSCGAIVYRKFHGNTEILLIKHVNSGHWSFPKGHVEPGETEVQTAHREILEETGIDVIIDSSFRETVSYSPKRGTQKETDIDVIIDPTFRETVTYSPKKDTIKVVVYFLAKAKNTDYVPQEDEIAEIRWIEIGRAQTVLTYENDKSIVNKARTAIV